MTAAFQYLKGTFKKEGYRLFSRVCDDSTKGNGFKRKEEGFRLGIKKMLFTIRVVRQCNRLTRDVVDVPFLKTFIAAK